MELKELAPVPVASLPIASFKEHLRLGTGFADAGGEDGLLERFLRAAIAEVEQHTGKALLERIFQLKLASWSVARLPIAPVGIVVRARLQAADGSFADLSAGDYALGYDRHRPTVTAVGGTFPAVPRGGALLLDLEAGFGPDWADVPPDLALAVMQLAARHYEDRTGTALDTKVAAENIGRLLRPWTKLSVGAR
ncbi:hypothetical protein [Actibacterium sp. 188UL27-1]|uniref:head-tail connector protein n=1 Tax=Actibacterium sp. 188UL27-1 TaxID=2786961 RepID=UPI001957BB48|nr:hypothetical protein [Actibacterium sp. 188UL27-1]MBM7068038.1 hypothetical protein [Actibacterium sp. 188UL27-1]